MPFQPIPASEQRLLAVGERLCDLKFHNLLNRSVSLYDNRVFGWPKVIHLSNTPDEAESELRELAEHYHKFTSMETQVIGVTRASVEQNARLVQRLELPFPLLSHTDGALHKAAGVGSGSAPRTLVFDAVLRLEEVIAESAAPSQIAAALAYCTRRFDLRRPKVIGEHAPVLMVRNLIDPAHCQRLIALWEQSPKQENITTKKSGARQSDSRTKMRRDVLIEPGSPESEELLGIVARRLVPEIATAFNFEVTRYEPFRVGCYDAADRGFFSQHRDNTTRTTRHRRYALTLNLNTGDYEGGYLRLPEYGPHFYAPPAGGGIVFSCSLLHHATPVTTGRRFMLVAFFWGEAEQPQFEESLGHLFPSGMDITRVRKPS